MHLRIRFGVLIIDNDNNATMQFMQNSVFSVFIEWPGQD